MANAIVIRRGRGRGRQSGDDRSAPPPRRPARPRPRRPGHAAARPAGGGAGRPAQARERLPAAVTTRHALALPEGTRRGRGDGGGDRARGRGRGARGGDRLCRLHAAGGRSGDAAGDLRGQRRAGGGVGLPQHRGDRAVAAADGPGRAGAVAGRDAGAERRDLAAVHRPRVRRSGRHRVQPADRAGRRASAGATSRSRATSRPWRRSCGAGWSRAAGSRRRATSSARATAASAGRWSPRRCARTRGWRSTGWCWCRRCSTSAGGPRPSIRRGRRWRCCRRSPPPRWRPRGGSRRRRSAAAEDYAAGDYVADLLRGVGDGAAVGRIVERVTALTGLDRDGGGGDRGTASTPATSRARPAAPPGGG